MCRQLCVWFLICSSAASFAQTSPPAVQPVTLRELATQSDKTTLGWNKKVLISSGLSLGQSNNVIGQPDGETNTYGLNFEGNLNRIGERDEWRNQLKIGESATRTPAIPRYSKVKDEFKIETLYLRTLENTPWFGPYVKASVETSVFKGEDIRAEAKTYEIRDSNGGLEKTFTGTSVRLTDGFSPATFKESVGGFFKIINKENMKVEARTGVGAVQVLADNQYAIKDNGATPQVEVSELASYEQVGLEGGATWSGSIDKKTSYSLQGEFLIPFVAEQKAGDDRSNFALTNWELKAQITSKLYDWLSLDYTAKVFRQPQLLDETQSQTLFLLNLTYQML